MEPLSISSFFLAVQVYNSKGSLYSFQLTYSLFFLSLIMSNSDKEMYRALAQHGDFTVNQRGGNDGDGGGFGSMDYAGQDYGARVLAAGNNRRGINNEVSPYNRPLKDNGSLNKRAVKHNSNTYYLAPKPAATADREVKSRVFEDAVVEVRNGEDTWQQKTSFICQYFQLPVMASGAVGRVGTLKDPTSPSFTWVHRGYFSDA